jgi:ABC-type molybdate transport system ATPase subunit
MRALLGKPSLLLLEEPLQHLNEERKKMLMDYLKNESNATIVLISNNKLIQQEADIVLSLEDGTLV